jgi:hypothetical protein
VGFARLAGCCAAGWLLRGWLAARLAGSWAFARLARGLLRGWLAAARLAGCCAAGWLLRGWLVGCCAAGSLLRGWLAAARLARCARGRQGARLAAGCAGALPHRSAARRLPPPQRSSHRACRAPPTARRTCRRSALLTANAPFYEQQGNILDFQRSYDRYDMWAACLFPPAACLFPRGRRPAPLRLRGHQGRAPLVGPPGRQVVPSPSTLNREP